MLGTDLRNNPTSGRYFIWRSSDVVGHALTASSFDDIKISWNGKQKAKKKRNLQRKLVG